MRKKIDKPEEEPDLSVSLRNDKGLNIFSVMNDYFLFCVYFLLIFLFLCFYF